MRLESSGGRAYCCRVDPAGQEWVNVQRNADAFDALRDRLLKTDPGKWALVYDGKLIGLYATLDKAYEESVNRFGFHSGSCIEQVEPARGSYNLNAELGTY